VINFFDNKTHFVNSLKTACKIPLYWRYKKQSMELIGLLFAGILIIIARLLGANKDNEYNTDKRTDIERFNDWNRY
jgi:hypothetical protein